MYKIKDLQEEVRGQKSERKHTPNTLEGLELLHILNNTFNKQLKEILNSHNCSSGDITLKQDRKILYHLNNLALLVEKIVMSNIEAKDEGEIWIIQQKISKKHNDSTWYAGLIATKGNKYALHALGEIEIYNREDETVYDSKERGDGIDGGFKDDNDLKKIDNFKYYWEHNNWFEILENSGDFGNIYNTYDEAIEALRNIGTQNSNQQREEV